MLLDVIAQPVETHVHGFRSSWRNGILDYAQLCHVVRLDGRVVSCQDAYADLMSKDL